MSVMTSPTEALEQYRSASQNWQDFRKERESTRVRLRDLLASADKPEDYPGQVEMLRERLAVLEWQINCAARDSLYTQRLVLDACVEDALEAFMTANGPALAGALAPCLNGAPGMDVAVRMLRSALARQVAQSRPEIAEKYSGILAESGLAPGADMRGDAVKTYTPAGHKVYQDRLNRLNTMGGQ